MNREKLLLVIYELVPEETRFYALSVPPDVRDRICRCHGLFAGAASNTPRQAEELQWLDEFLGGRTQMEMSSPKDFEDGVTIVWTGFLL